MDLEKKLRKEKYPTTKELLEHLEKKKEQYIVVNGKLYTLGEYFKEQLEALRHWRDLSSRSDTLVGCYV